MERAFKGEERWDRKKDWSIQNTKIENLSKSRLTLRGILHWTRGGARGAQLVDHSCDVLHLPVHHCLQIVYVEQVQPLQATLQSRDLAPGIAQAGRHPIQLHLGKGKEVISVHRLQSRWIIEVTSLPQCFTRQLEFLNRNESA